MKNYLLIAILLVGIASVSLSYNTDNITSLEIEKQELINSIPEDNILKRDMLESILEFADENTPIDSLDIPDWIFE